MTELIQAEFTVAPRLHIMYEGHSSDIDLSALDVGSLSTDTQIRQAVATYLNIPVGKLQNFRIDRNTATGDMTLRPSAVFGIDNKAIIF